MGDVLKVVRWLAWMFSLSLLGWVTPLHAASNQVHVSVEVIAPKECGSERAFWSALSRRSQRLQPAGPGADVVRVRVEIHRERGRMRGSLRLRTEGAGSEPRTVFAQTCHELVEALALTVALSLDPEADTAPRPAQTGDGQPAASGEPADASPAAPDAASAEPRDAAATPTTSAPSKPPQAVAAPDSPEAATGSTLLISPPTPTDTPLAVSLGASFAFTAPLLAVSALGADAYLAVSRKTRGSDALPVPVVELGAAYVTSGPLDDALKLTYRLWFAELNACLQQRLTDAWGFTGCLSQQAGQLTARGQRLAVTEATQRLWLASGVKLELMYSFSDAVAVILNARGHIPWMPQIYDIGTPPQALTRTSTVVPAGGVTLLFRP
jgi:hypothetical protein